MNKNIPNTRREMNLFYLKILYGQAFYWYLVYKGCKLEPAKMRMIVQTKD